MTELIISQVVNGLVRGLILALGSIGLTLVYRQLEIVNVAHGALYTVGARGGLLCVRLDEGGGGFSPPSCRRSCWFC